jgi:hypothetical protein
MSAAPPVTVLIGVIGNFFRPYNGPYVGPYFKSNISIYIVY